MSGTTKDYANTFYEVGTRFDLGGGRTGPDMSFEDGLELQRRLICPGHELGNAAVTDWACKFQARFNLPNTHGLAPGKPSGGTLNLWRLWQK